MLLKSLIPEMVREDEMSETKTACRIMKMSMYVWVLSKSDQELLFSIATSAAVRATVKSRDDIPIDLPA